MSRLVPAEWMPACNMSRVILHWTAGGPHPSEMDLAHYHILVARTGKLIRGTRPISANASTADGDYAAHTRRCNTGSIGVALCGMLDAKERPFKPGPYPMTKGQWNNAIIACADLCKRYGVAPTPAHLLMHSEVEAVLGIDQRGKWDISVRTWDAGAWANMTPGDELRARVAQILG